MHGQSYQSEYILHFNHFVIFFKRMLHSAFTRLNTMLSKNWYGDDQFKLNHQFMVINNVYAPTFTIDDGPGYCCSKCSVYIHFKVFAKIVDFKESTPTKCHKKRERNLIDMMVKHRYICWLIVLHAWLFCFS